jgi:hypothetical protein
VIVVMYQLVPTPKSFVGMMVMALGETCWNNQGGFH